MRKDLVRYTPNLWGENCEGENFYNQSCGLFPLLQGYINFAVLGKTKLFAKVASSDLSNLDSQGFLIPGITELE